MFRKLEQKKRSSYVVEEVLRTIRSERYRIGDKLPSEQEIAEMTGVSRPSVREALTVLRFVGILDTRIGDGTYVSSVPEEIDEVELQEGRMRQILENNENPFEALEVRRALESNAVSYAALRRSSEDLVALEKALTNILSCADHEDFDGLLHADKEFHLIIARACRNTLLERILVSLLEVLEGGMWPHLKKKLLLESQQHMEETRIAHQDLFDAIKAQKVQAACAHMTRHFDEIDRLIQGSE